VSPRAYRLRQIVCEACGRQCRAHVKERDICQTCLQKQPRARCIRCEHMKHYVDEESGLCPRCAPVAARPVAVCARCSRARAIYNLEEQLCRDCNKAVRQRERSKDRRVEVRCSVCGQMRLSSLLGRAICRTCRREERNGRGICSRCNRFRAIYVRQARLCKQCSKEHLAPQALRRYVENYATPYPYNRILFELLVATIDWASVTSKTDRKFRAFGQFLQTQQLGEPLTWGTFEQVLPPLKQTNRNKPKMIRACLLELAHLLVARGKLESWESYVARRYALSPINQAPARMQMLLRRYVSWLEERQRLPAVYGIT